MTLQRTANALTLLGIAFILYIGLNYLIDPHGFVTGFGLPESAWPTGDATAFMNLKGVRDLGSGIVLLALLLARQPKALGWALLAVTFVPIGDATTVLVYDGSLAAALGIHLATAAVVALTGVLQLLVAKRRAN